jgi:adenylate cyclase
VTRDGKAYQAVLTPISFPGWSLVTVVPESEFLGPVQMTIRNLLIGLRCLIVFAGLAVGMARPAPDRSTR